MKILLKRNTSNSNSPRNDEIDLGELSINTTSGKLYTKINNGSDEIVEVGKESQLAEVDLGWRLLNRIAENYGPVGYDAVDLSLSTQVSRQHGATGTRSFASGYNTRASGTFAHSEGDRTEAIGQSSHAEGQNTIANGITSHAEGYRTTATGESSHTEGYNTQASGENAHAEGGSTQATGDLSHAEGGLTIASGQYSHAEGYGTIADNDSMHAAGRYNTAAAYDTLVEIGIGQDDYSRKNALEIYDDGRIYAPELTPLLQSNAQSLVTKDFAVTSETDGGIGANRIASIVSMTQADYDGITPEDDVLYIIIPDVVGE